MQGPVAPAAVEFADQSVSLVRAEGQERDRLVRITFSQVRDLDKEKLASGGILEISFELAAPRRLPPPRRCQTRTTGLIPNAKSFLTIRFIR